GSGVRVPLSLPKVCSRSGQLISRQAPPDTHFVDVTFTRECGLAPVTRSSGAASAFVAIDWGTSSFRGWLMSAQGGVLAESRGSEGMLHCAGPGFAPVLRDHLARLGAPTKIPVLICGMAGARQGWVEAPYLNTPTRL